MNDTPFAIGKAATDACFTSGTLDPTTVTLDDGHPLQPTTPITGGTVQNVTTTTGPVSTDPTAPGDPTTEPEPAEPVATGCQCNSSGQCLPTYAWHTPCAPGEDYDRCEKHFTSTPCELGYTSQCSKSEVQKSYLLQLKGLHDRGLLVDTPEVALRKQLRTAAKVLADQATHDRQQANQQ